MFGVKPEIAFFLLSTSIRHVFLFNVCFVVVFSSEIMNDPQLKAPRGVRRTSFEGRQNKSHEKYEYARDCV